MPCSICQHADQAAMVEALTHDSVRTVAERYGVSKSTLARHTKVCPTVLQPLGQAGTMRSPTPAPVHGSTPLAPYTEVVQRLQRQAARAHDVASLQRLLVGVLLVLEQMTMPARDREPVALGEGCKAPSADTVAGERAPQADLTARQWNRL